MVTRRECRENSPWNMTETANSGKEICFRKNGKDLITVKLDRDNVVKLAFDLLEPFDYNPSMEKVSVSLCQSL